MTKRRSAPSRVREPVQVYLDGPDRDLLERLARTTGLSRAELLRRGLRTMAEQTFSKGRSRQSMDYLIGAFGDDPSIPPDLSERHDHYLYQALTETDEPGVG